MKQSFRPSVLRYPFLLALLVWAPLRAETVLNVATLPESGATIRIAVPWTLTPRFGFAPVRVSVENKADRERTWQVQFEAGMRNMFPGVLTIAEEIVVPAGRTRDVWVFVPVPEPGTNIGSGAAVAPGMPVVKITPTPTGMKVVRTHFGGTFTTVEVETDYDTTTGAITVKTTSVLTSKTRTQPVPTARPGSTVTYTIDPSSGFHRTSIQPIPGSKAPPVYKVEVGKPGAFGMPRGAARASVVPPSGGPATITGPSNPMMIVAEVTGPGVYGRGRLTLPGMTPANGMRPFAVTAALEADLRAKLSALVSGAPSLATVDPAQLPADWRVWSGFSGVIMTMDEYAALDASRRSALRTWVALGGQLGLSPTTNTSALKPAEPPREKVGAGTILRFPEPLSAIDFSPPAAPAGSTPAAAGRSLGSEIEFFSGTNGLPDRAALALDDTPLYEVVKDDATDSAWLAFFLVCFAVVVGPLNLFLFAPAKRRHRLFLTTPLIALAASLLLVATIFLQDGTGGTGARRAVVVLLPGENQAMVFQEQAARTGFLVRRNFPLADDIALAAIPIDVPAYGGPEISLTRGEGRAGGDWFRSRGRQAQQLRRVMPTRARIEIVGTAPDGAPIVQSSLGTTLREFSCIDELGVGWHAAELPSGQRVTLQSGVEQWIAGAPSLDGSPNLRAIVASAAPPSAGYWCARGGATELAPIPTLSSIHWEKSELLYVGELETPAGAPVVGAAAKTEGTL